jgi:glycosyltransferase involved in cell wall biosynthesis
VGRSLKNAGYDVVSICPANAPVAETEGIRFITYPPPKGFKERLAAVRILVELGLKEDADIYLAPEPESWVAALILKWKTGARVVFDMHEHVPSEFAKFFPELFRPYVSWCTEKFMRLFARYTDLIILTRDSFEPIWTGLRTPRCTVINTNHKQPPCSNVPQALQQHYADHFTLIHQGIFGDSRGSWQLLDAVKELRNEFPGLKCIVLGRYVYGSETVFRQAITDAGLDDVIDMLDEVPFQEVPAYIAVSKVGLILFQPGPINHTLAMPHKLFDYMREGIPVVAPDFAVEISRIVREGDCGLLVDTSNTEAIVRAIRHLLKHPDEAKWMGENGRKLVENKYHWEHDERILLDAFKQIPTRKQG